MCAAKAEFVCTICLDGIYQAPTTTTVNWGNIDQLAITGDTMMSAGCGHFMHRKCARETYITHRIIKCPPCGRPHMGYLFWVRWASFKDLNGGPQEHPHLLQMMEVWPLPLEGIRDHSRLFETKCKCRLECDRIVFQKRALREEDVVILPAERQEAF